MKDCKSCGLTKSLDQFYFYPSTGRHDSRCKECVKRKSAQWRANNRARYLQYSRDYSKRRHTLRTYGLTPAERGSLIASHSNRCDICGREGGALHVDHDHTTGAIRGVLCQPCNMALGLLGDTAEAVQRAADYLRSAEEAHGQAA